MELISAFIFGILAALIGFALHRILGFNIAGIFSAISVVYLVMPLLLLALAAPNMSLTTVIDSLNLHLTNFAQALPYLVFGHLGGAITCIALGQRRISLFQ